MTRGYYSIPQGSFMAQWHGCRPLSCNISWSQAVHSMLQAIDNLQENWMVFGLTQRLKLKACQTHHTNCIYIFTITTVYFDCTTLYIFIHLLYVVILYYILCIHIQIVSYCPSNIEPHSTTTSLRPALPALAAKAMSSWQRSLQVSRLVPTKDQPSLIYVNLWWFNSI